MPTAINGEKGFASPKNNSLDWWCKAHFFCAYAKEVLYGFLTIFFLLFLWAVSGKPCLTARSMNGTSRHTRQANQEEWFYPSDRTRSGQTYKIILPCNGLPGFTPPAMSPFPFSVSLFTDFSFEVFCQSASTSVYLHFASFRERIRLSFPFWAQR